MMESKRQLTSYEEMMENYATAIVETSTGKMFEVQIVGPGDFMSLLGSPLLAQLSLSATDLSSPDAVQAAIKLLPVDKQMEMVSSPDFMGMMKEVVCKSVISLNFVDKPNQECDRGKQEVSIEILPVDDLINLYTVTMAISIGEEERKDFYSFREALQDGEGKDSSGVDTPDSEGIRTASVEAAVPSAE